MGDELKEAIIKAHNEYRSKHEGTPSVVWCDSLAQQAQGTFLNTSEIMSDNILVRLFSGHWSRSLNELLLPFIFGPL